MMSGGEEIGEWGYRWLVMELSLLIGKIAKRCCGRRRRRGKLGGEI